MEASRWTVTLDIAVDSRPINLDKIKIKNEYISLFSFDPETKTPVGQRFHDWAALNAGRISVFATARAAQHKKRPSVAQVNRATTPPTQSGRAGRWLQVRSKIIEDQLTLNQI